ncbi:MAG: hypothetical protein ACUVWV_09400 [Thermodesulfobacteriota bacterium]
MAIPRLLSTIKIPTYLALGRIVSAQFSKETPALLAAANFSPKFAISCGVNLSARILNPSQLETWTNKARAFLAASRASSSLSWGFFKRVAQARGVAITPSCS